MTFLFHTMYILIISLSGVIFFTGLLIYPLTLKQKLGIYSFIAILSFCQQLPIWPIPINLNIFILIIGVFLLISIFKKHIFINLICSALNYFMCVCIDNIILSIYYHLGLTMDYFKSHPMIYNILLLIQTIILYVLIFYLGQKLRSIYFKIIYPIAKTAIFKRITFLLILELSVSMCIIIFNISYGNIMNYPLSVITFNTILFTILFVFTGTIIYFIIKAFIKEQQLNKKLAEVHAMQDYTKRLESLYMDIRTFRHDYINILSTFHSFISEKDYEGLEQYFEKTILPAGQTLSCEDISFGRLANLAVPEIKGIVYTKIFTAFMEKLNVILDIPKPIDSFPMESMDLTRILGILLDNAIEAGRETDKKMLYIGFLEMDKEKEICIQISNSSREIKDISVLYQLEVSSKGSEHGIGLFEVHSIAEKYDNCLLNTTYKSETFTQELQLYK